MEKIRVCPVCGFVGYAEDAVEVVRCKNCKHWRPHTQCGSDKDNDEYHDYCGLLIPDDDYYAYISKPDDYCSYGERREESEVE